MLFKSWDDEEDSGRGGQGMFLRLEKGNKYNVRLMGRAAKYMQHWKPVICRSPGPDSDPLMEKGHEPKPRYCIWVIDRKDGQMKIMDYPPMLQSEFKEYFANNQIEPGGLEAPDWAITVEDVGKFVKYKAQAFAKITQLTSEEREAFNKLEPKETLKKLRGPNTREEILEFLAKAEGRDSDLTIQETPKQDVSKKEDTKVVSGQEIDDEFQF